MSTVPSYKARVGAMAFRIHFQEKVEEIKPVKTKKGRAATSSNFISRILKIL